MSVLVNAVMNQDGSTAVNLLATHGRLDCIKHLVKKGADFHLGNAVHDVLLDTRAFIITHGRFVFTTVRIHAVSDGVLARSAGSSQVFCHRMWCGSQSGALHRP
jgi:hypothetical protein